jgi:hypothetical protein
LPTLLPLFCTLMSFVPRRYKKSVSAWQLVGGQVMIPSAPSVWPLGVACRKCLVSVTARVRSNPKQARFRERGAESDYPRLPTGRECRQLEVLKVWKQNHSAEIDSGTRYDRFCSPCSTQKRQSWRS